jgi:hypothetical protein
MGLIRFDMTREYVAVTSAVSAIDREQGSGGAVADHVAVDREPRRRGGREARREGPRGLERAA